MRGSIVYLMGKGYLQIGDDVPPDYIEENSVPDSIVADRYTGRVDGTYVLDLGSRLWILR